ncbi:Hsp20/alpha crystallin family protein [Rickettsiales bacterium]|nr:Hsp20/alpha crystallin family protein [Rickettsiales bacterium]
MTLNLTLRNRPGNIKKTRREWPATSLRNEMNQMFEDFFNDFQSQLPASSLWEKNSALSIPINIIENDKSLKIEAQLPGFKQEEVDITVNDNYLTIKAEKKESKEDKDEDYICREFSYESCQRSIALPDSANADKTKATFKKGVLWVEIPKKEEAVKPTRKIDIKEAA